MLQEGKSAQELTDEELEAQLRATDDAPAQQEQGVTDAEEVTTETPQEQTEPAVQEEAITDEVVKEETPKVIDKKKHDPVSGLKTDLMAERERRRRAEEQLAQLNARINALETQKAPQDKPKGFLDDFADDDVVPAKIAKQTFAEIDAIKRRLEEREQAEIVRARVSESERIARSEQEVRAKYSAEAVGDEMSYENVFANFTLPLIEADPTVGEYIRRSKNPAEEAYRIGLSRVVDPLKMVQQKAEVKKAAPKTLGQAQSAGGKVEANIENVDPKKLTDKQLEELLRKQGG